MSKSILKPRLFAVAAITPSISLARVAGGILNAIEADFDIHQLALGYDGDPHQFSWKLYPAASPRDRYGFSRIQPLVEQIRPDLIFFMADPWLVETYLKKLADILDLPPMMAYIPIDSIPLPCGAIETWSRLDRLVLCTDTSRTWMEHAFASNDAAGEKYSCPSIAVIPHALDPALFHPLGLDEKRSNLDSPSRRRALRQQHWHGQSALHDAFIVLNANRNQPRKRIDITMKGFAEFAHDKHDVYLYLHMGLKDRGWDLVEMARHFGIKEKLILSTDKSQPPCVSDERLNLIYNLCDVGLNTSSGEGWGLVSFEHAATGAAQIVPGFGNCAELWQGAADLLPPALTLFDYRLNFEENIIDPRSVADALEKLYSDRDYRTAQSRAAWHRTRNPALSPELLDRQWRAMFASVLQQRKPAAPQRMTAAG